MTKTSKKEIRTEVEAIIQQTLAKFDIKAPGKKTKKAVASSIRKITDQIRIELKKTSRKAAKIVKKNSKAPGRKVKKIAVVAA